MKVFPVIHKLVYNLEGGREVPTLDLFTSQTQALKHFRSLFAMSAIKQPDGAVTKVVSPMILTILDIPLNKTGLLFVSGLHKALAHKGFDGFVESYESVTCEYLAEVENGGQD